MSRGFLWTLWAINLTAASISDHHYNNRKSDTGQGLPNFDFETNYVSLTITPDVEKSGWKRMIVSWRVQSVKPNDWFGVFDTDPTNCNPWPTPVRFGTFPENTTSGWLDIDLTVDTKIIQQFCYNNLLESRCFKYWVVFVNGDTNAPLVTNCLKTQPNWMEKLPDTVKSLKLNKLFLPGTHNSGAYDKRLVQRPLLYFEKYIYNQDVDILSQLCYGVRYLDLRVGYNNQSTHLWWLHHGVYAIRPLFYILDDIKKFVESTNEIVIVEFHKFHKDFLEDLQSVHLRFYQYVTSYLGKYMTKLGWNKSLKDLQTEGHRVIVSYNFLPMVYANSENLLWPPIYRYWPNSQTLMQFENYIHFYIKKVQNTTNVTVLMAELTPTSLSVLRNKNDDLRYMSSKINKVLFEWFATNEFGEKCNIVAVDFVQSTDLIDAAIHWNRKKINSSIKNRGEM